MAKRTIPATQVHIVNIGLSAIAVPDGETLAKLLQVLARCQIVEPDFSGDFWRPRYREEMSFKTVGADCVHLDRPRPRDGCNGSRAAQSHPIDVGEIFPESQAEEPRPPIVRAKRLTHQQLLLEGNGR